MHNSSGEGEESEVGDISGEFVKWMYAPTRAQKSSLKQGIIDTSEDGSGNYSTRGGAAVPNGRLRDLGMAKQIRG